MKRRRAEPPAYRLETLEPRVLFSADSPFAAYAAANENLAPAADEAWVDAPTASVASAASPRELVIVDAGVPELEVLLADLAARGDDAPEVVVIGGGAADADEALARIGDALEGREALGAVHLITHGGSGALEIAGARVTTLDLLAANASVSGWGDAFAAGADLLIYGCDVAAGEIGRGFVDTLSLLTGADVAASTDLTGAAAGGGDWHLEYARGDVTAALAPSAALRADFRATLEIHTVDVFADLDAADPDYERTLRGAIERAVAGDTIVFSGPGTVALQAALPTITESITIDATVGTGWIDRPLVTLDGGSAGAVNGLTFGAGSDGSVVRGLAIVGLRGTRHPAAGRAGGHAIESSFIGTDGTNALGNGGAGVAAIESANNTIGGATAAQGNVLSGNGAEGILLQGAATRGNLVHNNLVGTNAAGDAGLGNGGDGVGINAGAEDNAIGGDAATLGNVISGNVGDGVHVRGAGGTAPDLATVQGNRIGTSADGTAALGNGGSGIRLAGGAHDILVGGPTAGLGNLISGNTIDGVRIEGAGTTGVRLESNLIGTNRDRRRRGGEPRRRRARPRRGERHHGWAVTSRSATSSPATASTASRSTV